MDAAAYLTSQGWRGDGHALHHSGRGITRPIHVLRKTNVLGVGKKQHDAHADQWWARAFDDTLKGLNTTKNEETGKTEGIMFSSGAQALQIMGTGGADWIQGGLYGRFVRGESLSGTLISDKKDCRETQSQPEDPRKRRKASNDMGLTTALAKDVKIGKRKRRQHEEDITEHYKFGGVDAVQQVSKDFGPEDEYRKPRRRPKDTETEEGQRPRRREKRARRALKVGESDEVPEQPLANASKVITTSVRPKRRNKEQMHTVENANAEATSACNTLLDEKRKDTNESGDEW